MPQDWKDILSGLKTDTETTPEPAESHAETPEKPLPSDKLHILIEKKGRKGKTATIIEGFTCNDTELETIASDLKRSIGTGGSARGGEILLQGDWREKAAMLLRDKGFRVS